MKSCHRCARPWQDTAEPGFNNTCDQCGIALHACANCEHYRPRAAVRCDLPDTDRVLDAVSSNRCRAFQFRQGALAEEVAAEDAEPPVTRDDPGRGFAARQRWDKLFG